MFGSQVIKLEGVSGEHVSSMIIFYFYPTLHLNQETKHNSVNTTQLNKTREC